MKPGTWPGFRCREVLKPAQTWEFLKLAFPGVLSMSEWCFWEATCFIAGNIGTEALAAHSIAYTLVPALYMFPLGVAIPLIQRVASLLGEGRANAAWVFALRGIAIGTLVSSCLALAIWFARVPIIHLFTRDEKVIDLCYTMWPWFCSFIVADGLFCMQESIPRALGMQFRLAVVTIVTLWGVGLPAIFWYAIKTAAGLMGIWYLLTPIYLLYNVLLCASYSLVDWSAISASIQAEADRRCTASTTDSKSEASTFSTSVGTTFTKSDATMKFLTSEQMDKLGEGAVFNNL